MHNHASAKGDLYIMSLFIYYPIIEYLPKTNHLRASKTHLHDKNKEVPNTQSILDPELGRIP